MSRIHVSINLEVKPRLLLFVQLNQTKITKVLQILSFHTVCLEFDNTVNSFLL